MGLLKLIKVASDFVFRNRKIFLGVLLLLSSAFLSAKILIHIEQNRIKESPPAFVEEEIKSYMRDFVNLAKKHGVNLEKKARGMSIQLTDLHYLDFKKKDGKWFRPAGWCFYFENIVGISKTYWEKCDPTERRILIFHELGHCLLGRAHEPVDVADPMSSIMEPELIEEDEYLANKQYYDSELFFKETFNSLPAIMTKEGSNSKKFRPLNPVDLSFHFDSSKNK